MRRVHLRVYRHLTSLRSHFREGEAPAEPELLRNTSLGLEPRPSRTLGQVPRRICAFSGSKNVTFRFKCYIRASLHPRGRDAFLSLVGMDVGRDKLLDGRADG